jgi:hypothetical protein
MPPRAAPRSEERPHLIRNLHRLREYPCAPPSYLNRLPVGVEKFPALPPTDEKGRRPEVVEHHPNLSPHDTLLLAYAKLAFIALWQIGCFHQVHFRLPISLPTRFRRDFETYEENEPGKQNELALYAMEKTLPDIRVNVIDMEGLSDLKNHCSH